MITYLFWDWCHFHWDFSEQTVMVCQTIIQNIKLKTMKRCIILFIKIHSKIKLYWIKCSYFKRVSWTELKRWGFFMEMTTKTTVLNNKNINFTMEKTIIYLLFFSEHKILLEMQLLSAHITLSFTTNFTFYCHSVWKLAPAKSGRYINLFVHYCICSL